jgi:hypothetical protein
LVIVDATLIGIERPVRHQQNFYSGKHKRHGIKVQIIADYFARKIICLAFSSGRVHDLELYRRSRTYIADDITMVGDLGYHGLESRQNIIIPKKKPKGGQLTALDRKENRVISSVRIFIENVIMFLKRFKILGSRYRNRRRRISIRTHIIACIYNNLRYA